MTEDQRNEQYGYYDGLGQEYPTHRTSNYGIFLAIAIGIAVVAMLWAGNAFAGDGGTLITDVKPACATTTLATVETNLDTQGIKAEVTNDPAKIAAAVAIVAKEYNDENPKAVAKLTSVTLNTVVIYPSKRGYVLLFFKDACGVIGFEVTGGENT